MYWSLSPKISFILFLLAWRANYPPQPWMQESVGVIPKLKAHSRFGAKPKAHRICWVKPPCPRNPSDWGYLLPHGYFLGSHFCSILHVCNFPPASTGIKKQWDALQNNPFGAQWFCFVSISVFSSFNIMVRFLTFLLNTSLNSYAMFQFWGFRSSVKMNPRLGSIGPQRRC